MAKKTTEPKEGAPQKEISPASPEATDIIKEALRDTMKEFGHIESGSIVDKVQHKAPKLTEDQIISNILYHDLIAFDPHHERFVSTESLLAGDIKDKKADYEQYIANQQKAAKGQPDEVRKNIEEKIGYTREAIKIMDEHIKNERKEGREPQMVTVNGAKVTHGHIFQSNVNPDDWFFSVKVDGQQLKAQHMKQEDVTAYEKKEIGVKELMERYHPTKLEKQLTPDELKAGNVLSDGRTIDKFSIYKEQNPERDDVGKYKMFAQVSETKVSTLAPREALNAYFDKTATPAQLVERHLGEKLNLASAYAKYTVPEGVSVENSRIVKDKVGDWVVKAKVDGQELTGKPITYNDGQSFFKHKTANADQLAAKYFAPEIQSALAKSQTISVGVEQKNSGLKV